MKNGEPCPRCEGEEIYEIAEASMPDWRYSNSVVPLALTAHYGEHGATNLLGIDKPSRVEVKVSAYVCRGCGYTELYAKDLELLERLLAHGDAGVRRVRR
jgi:predicted nucleic-acid-binding Zn-ribbon protein